MIISERVSALLQSQVANELRNRMAYKAMSSWAHVRGLKGIAKYFEDQANDELLHSDKILGYLNDANVQIQIPSIPFTGSYQDCESIARAYNEIEAGTTDEIDAIYTLAIEDKDFGTQQFLDWFAGEQVEEMGKAERFVNLVTTANGDLIKLDLMFS